MFAALLAKGGATPPRTLARARCARLPAVSHVTHLAGGVSCALSVPTAGSGVLFAKCGALRQWLLASAVGRPLAFLIAARSGCIWLTPDCGAVLRSSLNAMLLLAFLIAAHSGCVWLAPDCITVLQSSLVAMWMMVPCVAARTGCVWFPLDCAAALRSSLVAM